MDACKMSTSLFPKERQSVFLKKQSIHLESKRVLEVKIFTLYCNTNNWCSAGLKFSSRGNNEVPGQRKSQTTISICIVEEW